MCLRTCLRSTFAFDVRDACCTQAFEPFECNSATLSGSQRLLAPDPRLSRPPGELDPLSFVFLSIPAVLDPGGSISPVHGGRIGSSGSGSAGGLSRLEQRILWSIRFIGFPFHRVDTTAAKMEPKDHPTCIWDRRLYLTRDLPSSGRAKKIAPTFKTKRTRWHEKRIGRQWDG